MIRALSRGTRPVGRKTRRGRRLVAVLCLRAGFEPRRCVNHPREMRPNQEFYLYG
jgi:hypothetical protein